MEYADKESPSIYVKFRVRDADIKERLPALVGRKVFILIWTTTPWTLVSNTAIAVNPEVEYQIREMEQD